MDIGGVDLVWVLALLAGGGVFLVINAFMRPPEVHLERRQGGLFKRLQQRLDAAELPVTAREFLFTCLGLTVTVALLGILLGAPALAVAGLVVVPTIVWQRYQAQRDKFRMAYNQSLAETVQLLREGFSATGALRTALDHAARNGPDPAAADFRDVWSAQASGMDLEEGFEGVLERRNNPFLRMVAEALTLKQREGGSAKDVLLGLESMIRSQVAIRREISSKQAQARLESTIVSAAPLVFFLGMKLMPWMREYEGGFYRSLIGQLVLIVAIVFSMISYFMSNRLATRGLDMQVKEVLE